MAERRKQAAMDVAQIQAARITDLEAELAKLRADLAKALRLSVSERREWHDAVKKLLKRHDSQRAQGGGSAGRPVE
jgi:hypothetical protein